MNQTHLAAFAAVAECGTFSRAAAALSIGQPSVSQHVADLEAALKVKLFDRLPRNVRPTEAGRLLLDYARRIAAAERDAERAIAEWSGLARGRLAIAASTTIGAYLLPRELGRFRARHPSIDLDVTIGNATEVEQRLRDGDADVGLTEGFADGDGLDANVFHTDALVAIAPPRHAILSRKGSVVTARAFCDLPLIFREPGSGTRAVVESALARRRLRPTPILSLGSTEAVKQAVLAGLGVAIVSRLAISLELETKRLAIVPLSDLTIRRPLHAMRLKASHASPSVVAFVAMLAQ